MQAAYLVVAWVFRLILDSLNTEKENIITQEVVRRMNNELFHEELF